MGEEIDRGNGEDKEGSDGSFYTRTERLNRATSDIADTELLARNPVHGPSSYRFSQKKHESTSQLFLRNFHSTIDTPRISFERSSSTLYLLTPNDIDLLASSHPPQHSPQPLDTNH